MPGRRILLADDEPQVRSFVKTVLAAEQFDVVEALDGVDALVTLQRETRPFDLLITDIKMPHVDGIALAHLAVKKFPSMPVLFISGYMSASDLPTDAGVMRFDFLPKPFEPQKLLQRVSALLPPKTTA